MKLGGFGFAGDGNIVLRQVRGGVVAERSSSHFAPSPTLKSELTGGFFFGWVVWGGGSQISKLASDLMPVLESDIIYFPCIETHLCHVVVFTITIFS